MSQATLRTEPICQNCGNTVLERYCGCCGQENVNSRQPFHYLITHFIEDFLHYDKGFGSTLKALVGRPGYLTNIYLKGQRQRFVAPVKLYIFVSFVTFFILSILPYPQDSSADTEHSTLLTPNQKSRVERGVLIPEYGSVESITELDSVYAHSSFVQEIDYTIYKKILESGSPATFYKKYWETFLKNLPKVLFFYLPFFAFILWVFHTKRTWWYFDHGIFTLHYFSFTLLALLTISINEELALLLNRSAITSLFTLLNVAIVGYTIFYFFSAHYRVYDSQLNSSLLKGIVILLLNMLMLGFLLATMLTLNLFLT